MKQFRFQKWSMVETSENNSFYFCNLWSYRLGKWNQPPCMKIVLKDKVWVHDKLTAQLLSHRIVSQNIYHLQDCRYGSKVNCKKLLVSIQFNCLIIVWKSINKGSFSGQWIKFPVFFSYQTQRSNWPPCTKWVSRDRALYHYVITLLLLFCRSSDQNTYRLQCFKINTHLARGNWDMNSHKWKS